MTLVLLFQIFPQDLEIDNKERKTFIMEVSRDICRFDKDDDGPVTNKRETEFFLFKLKVQWCQ
jgi:hypothetical protein